MCSTFQNIYALEGIMLVVIQLCLFWGATVVKKLNFENA